MITLYPPKNSPLKLFSAPSEKIQKLFPSGEGVGYIFAVLFLIFIYPPSLGECKKCTYVALWLHMLFSDPPIRPKILFGAPSSQIGEIKAHNSLMTYPKDKK